MGAACAFAVGGAVVGSDARPAVDCVVVAPAAGFITDVVARDACDAATCGTAGVFADLAAAATVDAGTGCDATGKPVFFTFASGGAIASASLRPGRSVPVCIPLVAEDLKLEKVRLPRRQILPSLYTVRQRIEIARANFADSPRSEDPHWTPAVCRASLSVCTCRCIPLSTVLNLTRASGAWRFDQKTLRVQATG